MSGRVLVTGSGGKTGRAIVAALTARGAPVRALVRDVDRHADLVELAPGADVEVVRGDQREVDDLVAALDGCASVYAIAPNVSPHERAMAQAIVTACGLAGVDRLVYHSVVHPQLTAMPHHADKGSAEEVVIDSSLAWTILQPNSYQQNLAVHVERLRAGRYEVPYAPDRRLAMVDLREVGEVAAMCLTGDLGVHGTYELSGPDEVSPEAVAEAASAVLDRPVSAVRQDPDRWEAANQHLDEEARHRLQAMFVHYDQHGSPGNPTVLAALLGRAPGSVRSYLAELLAGPDGQG